MILVWCCCGYFGFSEDWANTEERKIKEGAGREGKERKHRERVAPLKSFSPSVLETCHTGDFPLCE